MAGRVVAVVLGLLVIAGCGAGDRGPWVDIADVPATVPAPPVPRAGAATGVYRSECGRNAEGRHNSDNLVVSPGVAGGAQHRHDYVGNVAVDAAATDASLAAATTTCANGDRSAYYWPVLLVGEHGTPSGQVVVPDSVSITFHGNPVGEVVAMPRFLRTVTGDPRAATSAEPAGTASWSCSGYADRTTPLYPLCPKGSNTLRIFEFPSCWNGTGTDSPNHRAHLVFPVAGVCPQRTFPVPRLRIEIGYELAPGTRYVVDSFPDQGHDPATDHAHFVNVFTDEQMAVLVRCLNSGLSC